MCKQVAAACLSLIAFASIAAFGANQPSGSFAWWANEQEYVWDSPKLCTALIKHRKVGPPYPGGAVAPVSVSGPTFRDWINDQNINHDIFYCPSRTDIVDSALRETWWNGTSALEGFIAYMNLTANIHALAEDETLSPVRIPPKYPGADLALFADLMFERYVVPGKWSLNHAKNGPVGYSVYSDEPSGGNVLLIDSHVEWRNFSEVELRYSTFKDHVYW